MTSRKRAIAVKKSHTAKALIISSSDRYIHFVSHAYAGKEHDYSILKAVFPPEHAWFENLTVRLDLGYKGFDKDYRCKKLHLPHRKPRLAELTDEQRAENKELAKERIRVEHSIGGMKRYRILSDRLRVHDFELYDDILLVCAGLWNFYLKHK